MLKLVVFDLDGTLLDTIEDIADACNYALEQCGCPKRHLEEYNMLIGRGIFNLFRGALPEDKRNEEMVGMMYKHFVPYYNLHICDKTKPFPGIYDMLDELQEKGISFAVASNKYQEGTEELVRRFFGKYDFRCILGQRKGKPIKPDPEIIFESIKESGEFAISETVYCGDSDVDMMTGNNAGVKTVGVTWGFRSREELMKHNPWLLAGSPKEISETILLENGRKA